LNIHNVSPQTGGKSYFTYLDQPVLLVNMDIEEEEDNNDAVQRPANTQCG
jgi:hypothetical protein